MRVGIVGYGFAGRRFHAYLISRVPELRLTAVASRDPERRRQAEQDYGVETVPTLDDLLARDLADIIVIATPHDTHCALACQAMAAGKHVVVDKVMCLSAAEAETMIACARQHGVLLTVFQNRRWDWDFLTLRQALAEDLIGAPYLFEAAIMRYRPPRGWRAEATASGGLLYDWGAHLVDQALLLVPGTVQAVTCVAQYRGWGREIGSYVRLTLQFSSDVLFVIEIGNLACLEKPRWLVLGEQGALIRYGPDPQEAAMLAGDISAASESPEHLFRLRRCTADGVREAVLPSVRGDWTDFYRNLAAALRGEAELAVKPEEVRRAMTVFDAARESLASGGTVRVAL